MYGWEFSETAKAQLVRMPYGMVDDLVETIALICADPWNFQRREDEPLDRHHAHRRVEFAEGRGTLWFLIRDGEGLIWITAIEWAE